MCFNPLLYHNLGAYYPLLDGRLLCGGRSRHLMGTIARSRDRCGAGRLGTGRVFCNGSRHVRSGVHPYGHTPVRSRGTSRRGREWKGLM